MPTAPPDPSLLTETPAAQFQCGTLTTRDFERIADFLHETAGIRLTRGKSTMVEGRLRRRLAATGHPSFESYCDHLFNSGGQVEEQTHLIDALTTNKTDFFREPEHFRLLTKNLLPEILARDPSRTALKIWSAACSTGAEPYTLAIVLSEFLQSHRGVGASILATDISTRVLETAAAAIYPEEAIAPVPPALRARALLRARDRSRDMVRIAPALRAMVRFGRLNLMQREYGAPRDFDVIFCRNVLIYFDRATQHAVLGRLCGHLRPGGYLILGHSESIAGQDLQLRPLGHTVFQLL